MIVLSGAALVLPDRLLSSGTLVIDGDRIVDVRSDAAAAAHALHGHYIVPGFIDVHVHGVEGIDALDAPRDDVGAIASIASRLPRYGVTAFCPTTVACEPGPLRAVLEQVRRAREQPAGRGARVLPAHLESNFINAEFRGAQPAGCLRRPPTRDALSGFADAQGSASPDLDIVVEIARAAPDVGIVTLAPELDGAIDLVEWLVGRGHIVSLGHSGATYDEALAAVAAGARQATHLFNRMPPVHHRQPGLAGAVLQTDEVAAELICDGVHVHPGMLRAAIAAKRPARTMAITDGTAASALPVGSRAALGGRTITAGVSAAHLDDGTLAGSTTTMDRAFRMLIERVGLSPVEAALLCSTTPAREMGLVGHGMLSEGSIADLVVLAPDLSVVQTYVGGQLVYSRNTAPARTV
jgi:N-acetylglucosamine-6-phosphate deacetylase